MFLAIVFRCAVYIGEYSIVIVMVGSRLSGDALVF